MARTLPTGVVTLLFTDIEGSTRLLNELGPAYPDALAGHRRVLREAFARHFGVEVDTQGDSFLVAFSRATDAAMAAGEAQAALADGPIKVRMAIHTGEPVATDEGYAGIDLHRGARIAASAHGGQVVVSESTRALLDVPIRDLGRHRLKDLSAPEHIFQLEIAGLRCDFPPLRTLESGRSNLPATLTSFVGRDAELRAIDELLDNPTSRVITLVGPGGAGKSRLAIEAARRRAGNYQHGVFHVPLVAVTDPDVIPLTIAETIGLTIDTMWGLARSRDEQLIGYLAERSTLLVLDNFEHLLDGAALVSKIGEAAPSVHVLVTSRQRLGLQAERVMDVPGLHEASEQLFVERARQNDAAFSVGDADRAHVSRICALVDHMPLGIELAAGWASLLSPAELAAELEKSLDMLTAAHRDVPERHRSLRAVFDWSWRLMTEEERGAFSRLSVFRGTFGREAAREVSDVDLPQLAALVGKSLVKRAEIGRFELHELLRQYAAEALLRDSGTAEAVRHRHAGWFADHVHARVERLRGAEMLDARDEVRLELGNLRVAAEWIAAQSSEADTMQALADLDAFYMCHSWSEGAELFKRLADLRARRGDRAWLRARCLQAERLASLDQDAESDAVATDTLARLRADGAGAAWDIGQCFLALGTNALNRGENQRGVDLLLEGRQVALESKDAHLLVWVDVWLGWGELALGQLDAAREHFDEALATALATGSQMLLGYAYSKLGLLADELGELQTGLRYHLQSRERFERNGDRPGMGYGSTRSSMSSYLLGDYEGALRYAHDGLEAFSEIKHPWGTAVGHIRVGFAAAQLGQADIARSHLLEGAQGAQAIGLRSLVVNGYTGLAVVDGLYGDPSRAAAILSAVGGEPGLILPFRLMAERALDQVSARVSPEQLAEAKELGKPEGLDRLVEPLLSS